MNIASIDIGTNTVLLLIAKVDVKTLEISPLLNEYRMPRLGKGLKPNSEIANDRIEKLILILNEYKSIISSFNVDKILITATNAFRIASNSQNIVDEIRNKFQWEVNIISGETEAKFAFLGAIPSSAKNRSNLVIDIGGGSTELIIGKNDKIEFEKSFKIGSVSATENYLKHSPPLKDEIKYLQEELNIIFEEISNKLAPELAIAISGTPTTLYCMIESINNYSDSNVDGKTINYDELAKIIDQIGKLTSTEIKKKYGKVMNGREDIILAGAIILLKIMELLGLSKIIVSTRGIRYGAIVHYLNQNRN